MTADRGRPELNLYALVGLGALNLGSLLLGLGIGWFVDGRIGTFPTLTLVGLMVGIATGVTASWFQIRKYFSDTR
ncbi:MAG TPA: AtpZ/AtpI family protein [Acidothermaceae bacterium]|jgi:F0F1-type ATP synthase assembly protein I